MRKQKIQLILISILLVILVAAYFIMMKHNKEEVKEEENSSVFLTMDTSEINQISVLKAEESAKADASSAGDSSQSSDQSTDKEVFTLIKENNTWYLKDDKSVKIDQDAVSTKLNSLKEVTSQRDLPDVTDFSQYGLDKPSLIIRVTSDDNKETEICIGDYNSNASGYYAVKDNNTTVSVIGSALYTEYNIDASTLEKTEEKDSSDAASSEASGSAE
jgi:uncharacterized protein YpmB